MTTRTRVPNRVLRDLRRAAGLTQARLAEQIQEVLERADIHAAPDWRLIAAWESGEIRWPGQHYRRALRTIFGVSSDGALGFIKPGTTASHPSRALVIALDYESEDPVRRQAFVRGMAAIALNALALGEPVQPWLWLHPSEAVNRGVIGMKDVEDIELATAHFAQWDHLRGGALFLDAVIGQLNGAATLLDQGRFANSAVRARMCSAVASLADVAGWCAYDAGLHARARRTLALGLHAATEAQDWPLRAELLADLARQCTTVGTPKHGLELLGVAHYGTNGSATATTRAMLHVVTARAYAAAGQPREAVASIGRAEEAYAHRKPDEDPPWLSYYTPAQLAGDSGCALFDAAAHDPSLRPRALELLSSAGSSYSEQYPRSAALCYVRVSALRFETGEPEEAARVAHAFLETAAGISSARLAADSVMLASRARPYSRLPEVEDVQHRLVLEGGNRV